MTIVERADGFYVVDASGKDAAGPFAQRSDAEAASLTRFDGAPAAAPAAAPSSSSGGGLHAPEPIGKVKMATRTIYVFSRAHRFSVAVGVWDQLAKMGEFDKGGPISFDPQTLAQGLKNFASRKNLLAMDYEHQALNSVENGQPAPALAFYSAMCLVVDGKLVAFDNGKDKTVLPPSPEQLVNPKTGAVEDGLYVYRCEVTPLGEQLLPNYREISPAFTTDGADEQGRPIGLDFLNLAATNTPFLDGMKPIELSRFAGSRSSAARTVRFSGGAMDELKKLADQVDAMKAALKKFDDVADMADDVADMMSRFKKFDDGLDAYKKMGDGDDAGAAMKKMADDVDAMAKAMKKFDNWDGSPGGAKLSDDDAAAMKKMARDLGCAPTAKAIAEKVAAMRFTTVDKSELAVLKTKLAEETAKREEREARERQVEIKAFAKQAIADGSWDPEDEAGLIAFRTSSPAEAAKSVERNKGKWSALQRFTANGHPVAGDPKGPVDLADEEPSVGGELVAEAQKLMKADPKLTFERASSIAFSTNPKLYRNGAAPGRR